MSPSIQVPKYRLRVTAGCDYNPETHQLVPVNQAQTLHLENDHAATSLCVRIQNYTGFPDNSPQTNPYFNHPLHHQDQYSISFAIRFKTQSVNSDDLVFGNDFDNPIRDRLPPGFNAALRLVQWTIDPSLDGDAYADKPFLYSPAVATWNQFRIGEMDGGGGGNDNDKGMRSEDHNEEVEVAVRGRKGLLATSDSDMPEVHDLVVEEGGEGDGMEIRCAAGIPGTVEGRRSHFQRQEVRKEFEFQTGRVYYADFGNRFLDFNSFTLRLPGFNINALDYIDEKTHHLRYVLKNRRTGQVYLVVLLTLVLISDDEENGDEQEDEGRHDNHVGDKKESGRFEWEPEPSATDVE